MLDMLDRVFHGWEHRIASATKDRVVRPFEWGLDGIPRPRNRPDPMARARDVLQHYVADRAVRTPMPSSRPADRTFRCAPGYRESRPSLTFQAPARRPTRRTTRSYARYASGPQRAQADEARRAVIVLPQWNADADGHVGLCRLLNRFGLSALGSASRTTTTACRRSCAAPTTSSARTSAGPSQVCRQAVLDARRAIEWLARAGLRADRHPRHEPRLVPGDADDRARAADSRRRRSTTSRRTSPTSSGAACPRDHVREGLDGHIELETLRRLWMPICPCPYLDRVRDRSTLLVYARYDLTFPRRPVADARRASSARAASRTSSAVLPCGHYSTGLGAVQVPRRADVAAAVPRRRTSRVPAKTQSFAYGICRWTAVSRPRVAGVERSPGADRPTSETTGVPGTPASRRRGPAELVDER